MKVFVHQCVNFNYSSDSETCLNTECPYHVPRSSYALLFNMVPSSEHSLIHTASQPAKH